MASAAIARGGGGSGIGGGDNNQQRAAKMTVAAIIAVAVCVAKHTWMDCIEPEWAPPGHKGHNHTGLL